MKASVISDDVCSPAPSKGTSKPQIGFLGVGWIGRHRMEAIGTSGLANIVAVADSAAELAKEAAGTQPGAVALESFEDLLEWNLDGLVIATPSALHAGQAISALERGIAVFCQKPLARNHPETRRVIDAARTANRLLAVDLSYRFMAQVQKVRALVCSGELGKIFAADLVFHNAYGPDKRWFYDKRQSGGGCVIDLGIHLVDLALWMLDFPRVTNVTGRLFEHGQPLRKSDAIEDYATARLDLSSGATVQLACSWKLSAGCDAIIAGTFYGTSGSASFRNVGGSFYQFVAEHCRGRNREVISCPAEVWGGKAAMDWVTRLARNGGFDPAIERLLPVSATLDSIYEY